jgi:signal transduction histidine kinase
MEETSTFVVVIDDTEGNRYVVARLLRGAGMRVAEAGTARDGLALIAQRPDLVVVDVNLPDINGSEVVRMLRSDPATATMPIMHVSASFTEPVDRALGLDSGADAYITHPIEPVIFLATVRALLRAARAEAKTRAAAREWLETFDAIGDAIFMLDEDGHVRRCNVAAAALVRREPGETVGRPLRALIAAATGGDAEGEAMARVIGMAPVRNIELRLAERWFNVTASRPENGGRGPVVCVLTDISVRKTFERERELLLLRAEEARRVAETANQAKSDFLAIASHELRTPLNAIAGFVQLLALGIRGPVTEAQLADLDKIRRSQVALTTLINDLLSFARLERGSITYDFESVSVNAVLGACAEMVDGLSRERGLVFRWTPCPPAVTVLADADKLQQILINLLSNSIKFTPAGGAITLSGTVDEESVCIRVEDTGRGIPTEKLNVIFDPFVQVDQRRVRAQEGIGLGLSISRELARGMNGDLTVESVLGEGSTFTLRLPVGLPGRG